MCGDARAAIQSPVPDSLPQNDRPDEGWLSRPSTPWKPGRRWLALALALFALVSWAAVTPHGIHASWRECDTQAIARNFLLDGFDLTRPRVDWRGDSDGAVECEFPLYQALVAVALRAAGDVEWPGRLISLFCIVLTSLALHRLLEQRSGGVAALAGTLVFLSSGQAWLLSSRVTPDALSLALAVAGISTYVAYLAEGRGAALWLAATALALAVLQKPTALQSALLLLGWTAVLAPRRLRETRLWVASLGALALVVVWLAHGASLHAQTGLTFGVVSGGDTKFPALEHLLDPALHVHLAKTTARYGLSLFGLAALALLALRRRLDRSDLVLLGTVLVGLIGTLRYSYNVGMGAHYHAFAAMAGSYFVARAWPQRTPRWFLALFALALVAHGGWQFARECGIKERNARADVLEIAKALQSVSEENELAVIRAEKPERDEFWKRRNNYEDPRILYHARRRGWVVPIDGLDEHALEDLVLRGARLLVDVTPHASQSPFTGWLARRAELVLEQGRARVYRLRPRS